MVNNVKEMSEELKDGINLLTGRSAVLPEENYLHEEVQESILINGEEVPVSPKLKKFTEEFKPVK